jgi:hypothetical protein
MSDYKALFKAAQAQRGMTGKPSSVSEARQYGRRGPGRVGRGRAHSRMAPLHAAPACIQSAEGGRRCRRALVFSMQAKAAKARKVAEKEVSCGAGRQPAVGPAEQARGGMLCSALMDERPQPGDPRGATQSPLFPGHFPIATDSCDCGARPAAATTPAASGRAASPRRQRRRCCAGLASGFLRQQTQGSERNGCLMVHTLCHTSGSWHGLTLALCLN